MTKAQRTLSITDFQCPLCQEELVAQDHSFRCRNGHCYNVSKKGTIHFKGAPSQQYDQALFASRQRIFAQGFYEKLIAAIQGALPPGVSILDVGCGEGSLIKALAACGQVIGLDLSPDAIKLACQGEHAVSFISADATRLPIKSGSQAVILNVLSLACYAEFRRVLQPDGLLIKVVPGPDYLKEIRALLNQPDHDPTPVINHLKEEMIFLDQKRLTYGMPVSSSQLQDLVTMTPLSHGKSLPQDLDHITMDLIIITAKNQE